jgi:hypothetical protein
LSQVGETQQFLLEQPGTPLGADYAELGSAPTPSPGIPYVALETEIAEVLGARTLAMDTPWSNFTLGSEATFTKFYKDAYVARFETGYMDFGDADLMKNFLELRTTWQRQSRAYLGVYAETDDGKRGGKFRGLIFNRETVKIPINLCGRRIRVRGVIVLFNSAKALLRDISIGWLPAGTT